MAFRPDERIRRRAEFQRAYEKGARIRGRYSTLFVLANQLDIGRLGIAASRKVGSAVARNRAKRLMREVFRRNKIAPGYDIVVIPNRDLLDAGLTVLEADFRHNVQLRLRGHQ